jgi:hypothetical protein
MLLKVFSSTLVATVEGLKVPQWEVCVEQPVEQAGAATFDVPLAIKMLKGKLPTVIAGHKKIREQMVCMSTAAELLDIKLRLEENELTIGPVRVAKALLTKLVGTHTVIQGIELVAQGAKHASGPQVAQDRGLVPILLNNAYLRTSPGGSPPAEARIAYLGTSGAGPPCRCL